jgi:hypothetical protein
MLIALCRARRCRSASEILGSINDLAIVGRHGLRQLYPRFSADEGDH